MDLPTYTNIWRIEKRLYKLYDFRLPMPLPINWIAVFAGITIPYIILLIAIGLPFNHTLVWLYILPPGLITWLTTRPVIENKRLPELLESQVRYLTEPRTWARFAPLTEKEQMVVTARVWHSSRPAAGQPAEDGRLAPAGQEDNSAQAPQAPQAPSRASRPAASRKRSVAAGTQDRSRLSATGLAAPRSGSAQSPARDVVPAAQPRPSRWPISPASGPSTRAVPDVAPPQPVQAPLPAVRRPSAQSRRSEGMPVRARGGAPDGARLEMAHDGPGRPPAVVVPPAKPVRPVPPATAVNAWPAPARPLRRVPQETQPSEPAQPSAALLSPAPTSETSALETPVPEFGEPEYQSEFAPASEAASEAASAPASEAEAVVEAEAESAAAEAGPQSAYEAGPDPAAEAAPEAAPAEPEPEPTAEAAYAAEPETATEPESACQPEPADPPEPAVVREPVSRPEVPHQPEPARPASLERAHEPAQPHQAQQPQQPAGVTASVEETARRAVPSIERALSGPSRDRNLSWHGTVKIVTGAGTGAAQGPGARDQEALDRNRARLTIAGSRRILILGCTAGAGQTVTALMTGYMLASLREQAVAAVDLHDGTLARYRAPAAWLGEILAGRPPQTVRPIRPDGLLPTPKASSARLDVIASHEPLGEGDEIKLAVQLSRHYPLAVLDGGPTALARLLRVTDQLVLVAPANVEAAGALADTRDWLDAHGHADLAMQSVTVINGVSRRSLPEVEQAESIARGRSRAIVRVPWDDMLPVAATGPSTLRPQTRVAYTALAGVLAAGLAAAPGRKAQ